MVVKTVMIYHMLDVTKKDSGSRIRIEPLEALRVRTSNGGRIMDSPSIVNIAVNQTIPPQEQHKDFRQIAGGTQVIRRSNDKLMITIGHEELVTVSPMHSKILFDVEIVLTAAESKNLADNIYMQLESMGFMLGK